MTERRPSGAAPIALLAVLALAACGAFAPSASDAEGAFRLIFRLPQATYQTTDAISGTATLAVTDGQDASISASGDGPLGFTFVEVGGTRRMDAAWRLSCGHFTLEAKSPMTSAITKSAGWDAEDPNAAFYQAFIDDPEVHLPRGTWDISAVASFSEGDCGGVEHYLTATIRVTVTP